MNACSVIRYRCARVCDVGGSAVVPVNSHSWLSKPTHWRYSYRCWLLLPHISTVLCKWFSSLHSFCNHAGDALAAGWSPSDPTHKFGEHYTATHGAVRAAGTVSDFHHADLHLDVVVA